VPELLEAIPRPGRADRLTVFTRRTSSKDFEAVLDFACVEGGQRLIREHAANEGDLPGLRAAPSGRSAIGSDVLRRDPARVRVERGVEPLAPGFELQQLLARVDQALGEPPVGLLDLRAAVGLGQFDVGDGEQFADSD
jgi:hypothetical protein